MVVAYVLAGLIGLLPLMAMGIGAVILFDLRGLRTARVHPGTTWSRYSSDHPSASIGILAFGAVWLLMGAFFTVGFVIWVSR